ncbi:hypothetical protein [Lysobacter gummosus]
MRQPYLVRPASAVGTHPYSAARNGEVVPCPHASGIVPHRRPASSAFAI